MNLFSNVFDFLDDNPVKNMNICITGKLSISRNDAYTKIVKLGGNINLSVNHETDILIVGELKTANSKKLLLAKKYGVKIMNESEIFTERLKIAV